MKLKKESRVNALFLSAAMVLLCFVMQKAAAAMDTKPQDYYQSMISNPNFKTNPNGEGFCWHAGAGMEEFIRHYTLTRDPRWLDWGLRYCDFLVGKMDTDPDGYRGWIGPAQRNEQYFSDVLVGDGLLAAKILMFPEVILKDRELRKIYGDQAQAYVSLAQRDIMEKWDKRGCWHEDGPCGVYAGTNNVMKPGLKEWRLAHRDARPTLSLPFNQFHEMALVALRLYRITGEPCYRDKAEKMFAFSKSRFQFFENHYVWSYWEPFGPWDIDLEKKDTKHWVGAHGYRSGYQAAEVSNIVEAYQSGIVFDAVDIERIINTNLRVMWNQDRVRPYFINSNGRGAENDTTNLGSFQKAHGHSNTSAVTV
jgi:hypothetical protein